MTLRNLTVFPINKALHTSVNPALIEHGSLTTANNITSSAGGAGWLKAPGIVRYDDTTVTPGITSTAITTGLFDFWRLSGTSKIQSIVAFIGGIVFADSGNGAFTNITGAATLVSGDAVTFDTFVGVLIMTFERAVPHRWTGSGNIAVLVAASGSVPDASICRVAKRRLFLNEKTVPDRLHITAAGTFDDFARGDTMDFDEGDDSSTGITAIFPELFGDVYVTKKDAIYRLREIGATGVFAQIKSVSGLGCISHNGAEAIQGDVIFPSDRGIHSLRTTEKFGDIESTFLTTNIHDFYIQNVDFNRANEMWGVYYPEINCYVLVYTRIGAPYPQDALVLNLINKQWYAWTNLNVTALAKYTDDSRFASSRRRTNVMAGMFNGRIGVFDTGSLTRLGSAVVSTMVTGVHFPFGYPSVEIGWNNIDLLFRPKGDYNFTMTYLVDGNTQGNHVISQSGAAGINLGTFVLSQDKLGRLGDIKTVGIPLHGKGKGIQFIFQQRANTLATFEEDIELLGYNIVYDDLNATNIPKVL